ncbi:MAG TPA: hypothetical protein VH079_04795 [Terriglobales bacterium]|jgi:hypothetical protein|nr:hypothetical protein [Terriglobales bacterium]
MTSSRGFAAWLVLVFLSLGALPSANALPAFARKYGLRCSACHEAWPMLNYFGQKFKDNGYQLMNDRDAPIWQNPSYWPITFRITPNWHRESTNKIAVDTPAGPSAGFAKITYSGFDLTGLDILAGGTLDKNISFLLVPSSDETGAFHFESVNARLDNLFGSSWLNLKMGKFELDNIVSEKRVITLSSYGGGFNIYHFIPAGDGNIFGQIGDNQLGVEWMGHSVNDRTRLSAALLSSTDGNVDLPYGSNAYSGFFAASQAFDVGKLGTDRIGAYAMIGQAPTTYLTSGGIPLPNSGIGNKSFSREGFVGLFYFGKLDFQVVTQHGQDSAWFGACYGDIIDGATPCTNNNTSGTVLPVGARSPTWNGAFVETHYVYSPQLIFIQRSEWVRNSQQGITNVQAGLPSNYGDIDTYLVGYRYMPIMTSRAGFAWHNEYSWIRYKGLAPDGSDLTSSSLMLGFDFAF